MGAVKAIILAAIVGFALLNNMLHVQGQQGAYIIQNDTMWLDLKGRIHITGEVLNAFNVWVGDIQITGVLLDKDRAVVDDPFTFGSVGRAPPGGLVPFDLWEADPTKAASIRPDQVQNYSLRAGGVKVDPLPAKLTIDNVVAAMNELGWLVLRGRSLQLGR